MTVLPPALPAWLEPGTRTRTYLEARRALLQEEGKEKIVELAFDDDDAAAFWTWYASMLCPASGQGANVVRVTHSRPPVPAFPDPGGGVALWFSGGAESTYTLKRIEHLRPTLLRYEDLETLLAPYRGGGQVHLVLAAVSAGMGFSVAYLGVERNDLLLGADPRTWRYVERTPLFIQRWNRFHPQHRLRTCCGELEKEQIVAALLRGGIVFSSCDRQPSGWCRNCFKCFEAYYSAKAVGLDIGFRLSTEVFDQIHDREYLPYVASGFRLNPFNALQYFVRLQIVHGLTFDRDRDCE